jgi:hypothetical protein
MAKLNLSKLLVGDQRRIDSTTEVFLLHRQPRFGEEEGLPTAKNHCDVIGMSALTSGRAIPLFEEPPGDDSPLEIILVL